MVGNWNVEKTNSFPLACYFVAYHLCVSIRLLQISLNKPLLIYCNDLMFSSIIKERSLKDEMLIASWVNMIYTEMYPGLYGLVC